MTRECKNSPDNFCYVCARYTPQNQRRNLTPAVKEAFTTVFQRPILNLEKSWTPSIICSICRVNLQLSVKKGGTMRMTFNIPATWREPRDHVEDCYFCKIDVRGFNTKNKDKIEYPTVPSVDPPRLVEVEHDKAEEVRDETGEVRDGAEESRDPAEWVEGQGDAEYVPQEKLEITPRLLRQETLNDLARDLHLSKELSELLGSRMQEWGFLRPGVHITHFRTRDLIFRKFFSEATDLTYASDIDGLMEAMKFQHNPEQWRLFIDSSSSGFKAVLLHIGNKYPSVPIAYSTTLKEKHETIKYVFEKVEYERYRWRICGDLKMVALILGLQLGYTKYCCFLCEWDSRARSQHYIRKDWPTRDMFTPGKKNIAAEPLTEPDLVFIPDLHLKLGLAKNFVKALDKDGDALTYLKKIFPALSIAKIKEGVFVGPQIKKLMRKDDEFKKTLNDVELQTWESLKRVFSEFFGSRRSPEYKEIVQDMLTQFHRMGVNMSLKIHFLDSHLDFFPENSVDVSDEHGERFHQDISMMEKRYHGKTIMHMLSDYCWTLVSEDDIAHKRQSSRLSFQNAEDVKRRKTDWESS